jgi:uncharacterized UBP type Zn finger protein
VSTQLNCNHLDQIQALALPAQIKGCEECLKVGGSWEHLRMCMSCGTIRCCDSSPNQHARKHARDSGHPIVRSAQPGEEWSWCFVDSIAFVVAPE